MTRIENARFCIFMIWLALVLSALGYLYFGNSTSRQYHVVAVVTFLTTGGIAPVLAIMAVVSIIRGAKIRKQQRSKGFDVLFPDSGPADE